MRHKTISDLFFFFFFILLNIRTVLQIRRANRDNLGIISHISLIKKTYFVTHHSHRLSKTVLMRGHNICFH